MHHATMHHAVLVILHINKLAKKDFFLVLLQIRVNPNPTHNPLEQSQQTRFTNKVCYLAEVKDFMYA